jgi:DGQHR domain-containing protein
MLVPTSTVKTWVTHSVAGKLAGRGWTAIRERDDQVLISKKLPKWQRFEMEFREFLRDIHLEDRIEPTDFSFSKYGDYQLDACGGLAGHFVLVDCCSANEPGSRPLKEKIKDFHVKIPDFRRDVEARFRGKYPSLHFVICTLDIDVADADIEYALDRGIHIIPSEAIGEWMKIAEISSPILGFQFMEHIAGEKIKIPDCKEIRVPAMRIPYSATRDGRSLYAFVASPNLLLKLSFIYRLEYKDVKGYQRPLKLPKLRKINRFLAEDAHSGFPNSLLVSFDETADRRVEFEPAAERGDAEHEVESGTLVIPPYYGIAEIVDGQHRLYGYYNFSGDDRFSQQLLERQQQDQLLVVAYPDPEQVERPRLFLDINSNQTRISTRQLWAMMARSRPESQMGYIANVMSALNQAGPLKGKIEIPGQTRGTRPLNIANVGKGIQDRHLLDNRRSFDWNIFDGPRDLGKYPAEPSSAVVQSLNALFEAARESARDDWAASDGFLQTNNGINVLLRVYCEILKFYRRSDRTVKVDKSKTVALIKGTLPKYIDEEGASILRRRTSAEVGRESVASEIMMRVARKHRGFAPDISRRSK